LTGRWFFPTTQEIIHIRARTHRKSASSAATTAKDTFFSLPTKFTESLTIQESDATATACSANLVNALIAATIKRVLAAPAEALCVVESPAHRSP